MREREYLSPTSMSKWAESPENYYKVYLSDQSEEKEPQTQPMSVGSAFDAFVKSYLYEALFGSPSAPGNDPRFSKEVIFEEQVEPHNRDFARKAGEHCFTMYRLLGALDGLLVSLGRSKGPPKFEMDIRGAVSHGRNGVVRSVPFRVKPDLHFINEHDAFVILDWKVNGYCSHSGVSPQQGFILARRQGKMPWTHDECVLGTSKGMLVNKKGLEAHDADWAKQCSIGAWVCGAPVGSDFIAVIHQLAVNKDKKITVAEHVGHVSAGFQENLHAQAVSMWTAITERLHDERCTLSVPCGCPRYVFRHMKLEDSIALCNLLDKRQETRGTRGIINPALD